MEQQQSCHQLAELAISRRALLGAALATGLALPLLGMSSASADGGTRQDEFAEDYEDYEIPDEIGSLAWW